MSFVNSFKNIFNKQNFLNFLKQYEIIDYLTIALVFLSSGYALTTFGDTFFKTLMLAITTCVILFRYIWNFNIITLNDIKKTKKVLPSFIFFVIIGLGAFATLLFNKEFGTIMSYVYFGILMISSFLLCRIIEFKKFITIFLNILSALTLLSIIIFIIHYLTGVAPGLYSFNNGNGTDYQNWFFINFLSNYSDGYRLASIFWEPGLFSSFLLIGLLFEIIFVDKINLVRFSIFVLALILTKSTAAYILFFAILILIFYNKIKKNSIRIPLISACFILIVVTIVFNKQIVGLLSKILPSVFSKAANGSTSLYTRILSPKICIDIFVKHPIFGAGIGGAGELYAIETAKYGLLVDALTNTTFYSLAEYGVIGLTITSMLCIGLIKNKEILTFNKYFLLLLFFVIFNKEPHGGILLTNVIILYFFYEGVDHPYAKKYYLESSNSKKYIKSFFIGNNDSNVFAKNTAITSVIKGIAIIIGFFTVPIYSVFFGGTEADSIYGVWLTILSVLGWILSMDLGLGNGMKNKLIKAISDKDDEECKKIVSSGYISSFFVTLIIISVGVVLINLLNLVSVFNIGSNIISEKNLKIATIISFTGIGLEFCLKNIASIYQAYQKQGVANIFSLISTILMLVTLFVAKVEGDSQKLIFVAAAYAITINIPYVIGTCIAFFGKLRNIRPSLKYASVSKAKEVMNLGLVFFVIQIALLVINSTDQILISNIFGSGEVVVYTKYTKIYNVIMSFASIGSVSVWTAAKKAISDKKPDLASKLNKFAIGVGAGLSFLSLICTVLLQAIIDLWLGASQTAIQINFGFAFIVFAYSVVHIFIFCFSAIANGVEALKSQTICLIAAAILKIPLVFLLNYLLPSLGWINVIISDIVVLSPCLIFIPLESNKKMKECRL